MPGDRTAVEIPVLEDDLPSAWGCLKAVVRVKSFWVFVVCAVIASIFLIVLPVGMHWPGYAQGHATAAYFASDVTAIGVVSSGVVAGGVMAFGVIAVGLFAFGVIPIGLFTVGLLPLGIWGLHAMHIVGHANGHVQHLVAPTGTHAGTAPGHVHPIPRGAGTSV